MPSYPAIAAEANRPIEPESLVFDEASRFGRVIWSRFFFGSLSFGHGLNEAASFTWRSGGADAPLDQEEMDGR
jgi:hypothetical protein